VDIPVSLARGIITTDFDVNIHAFYSINVGLSQGDPNLVCKDGTVLETGRISSLGDLPVYRYQRLEDAIRRTGRDANTDFFLGGFESRRGHYALRIEVLSDTACLNEREPRLYVVASYLDFNRLAGYYDSAFWISLVAGSAGLGILVVGVREKLRRPPSDDYDLKIYDPRIYDPPASQRYVRRREKTAPWVPFFSQLGVLYSQTLLILAVCSIPIFHYAFGGGQSYGFYVLTPFPESFLFRNTPCAQTWVVRVKSNGIWYLNAKKIRPDQLFATLRSEIDGRTNCVISFDADPDVPFYEAIHAIELIEQTPGRVVLLTPKIRHVRTP
jgi:hypothetical protein